MAQNFTSPNIKNASSYFSVFLTLTVSLAGCSATGVKVTSSKSPVDGIERTIIDGGSFSKAYIYPVEGTDGLGVEIAGGQVIDNKTVFITFKASSRALRSAMFKADEETIKLTSSEELTRFSSDEYGVNASRSFLTNCDKAKKIASSKDVYLRITYSDGFIDYDVSKSKYSGADGFAMIKKIAEQCH